MIPVGFHGNQPMRPDTAAKLLGITGHNAAVFGGALWTFDEASGDLISKAATPGYIRKTAADGFDTGVASSVETAAGDCAVTRPVVNDSHIPMIGLDPDDNNPITLANTRFNLYRYAGSGNLEVWENGSPPPGLDAATLNVQAVVGDVIGVRRVGTAIEYTKNGITIATSPSTSTGALRAVVNQYRQYGESILTFTDAGVNVPITWQHVSGLVFQADLAVNSTPTFGDVVLGRRGIGYGAADGHYAKAFSFGAAESFLFCGEMTIRTSVNQTQVMGSFETGSFYSMIYESNVGELAFRAVSGATVHIVSPSFPTVGVPAFYVGQVDRSGPTMRFLWVQKGRAPVVATASCAGLGAITDRYGPCSYSSAACDIQHSWEAVLRGPQCQGSSIPTNIAARLGWI